MKRHSNTVPVSGGRVHKYTITNARRLVNILTSNKTPERTRAALRRTLQNLFDQTDIGKRASLTRVENVAAVLGSTGPQYIHLGEKHKRALKARIAMYGVVFRHDWTTNPQLIRIAALIAAEKEAESRPRAEKAIRPHTFPAHRLSVVQQIAA